MVPFISKTTIACQTQAVQSLIKTPTSSSSQVTEVPSETLPQVPLETLPQESNITVGHPKRPIPRPFLFFTRRGDSQNSILNTNPPMHINGTAPHSSDPEAEIHYSVSA